MHVDDTGEMAGSVGAVHHREGSATAFADGVLIRVTSGDELLATQRRDFLAEHVAAHLVILANDVRDLSFFHSWIRRSSFLAFNNVGAHDVRVSPSPLA